VCTRNSVTEQNATIGGVTGLHPQTHSELGQTGHAPDVDKVTDTFDWKVQSVVFEKRQNYFIKIFLFSMT